MTALDPEAIDALVARARAGDREAFRGVVLALETDVRLHLAAFDASLGLAEETLQATFVTAYQKLDQYRGQGAFRAWLKTIARNHLFRALREQRRLELATPDVIEAGLVDEALAKMEADAMEDEEARTRRLRACLDRLPAAMRALVDGRYVAGLSSSRLAADLQRSEIWVRVTLCRVRQSLRRCIEADA